MQDRLPSAYTRALKLPLRSSLRGIDMHNAVLDLALSYYHNYGMIFPAISDTPTIVHFVRQLTLPGKCSQDADPSYIDCSSGNAHHSKKHTIGDEVLFSITH